MVNKEKRIRSCKHCFALIKEGEWIGGFHSSDYEYDEAIIECIKCGLTNKNKKLYYSLKYRYLNPISEPLESKLFNELVYNHGHSRIPFDIDDLDMLSKEKIGTRIPRIFYVIAMNANLNLDINYKESYPLIFETMKELIKISEDNHIYPNSPEKCYKLIDLYNNNRTYSKEIK